MNNETLLIIVITLLRLLLMVTVGTCFLLVWKAIQFGSVPSRVGWVAVCLPLPLLGLFLLRSALLRSRKR